MQSNQNLTTAPGQVNQPRMLYVNIEEHPVTLEMLDAFCSLVCEFSRGVEFITERIQREAGLNEHEAGLLTLARLAAQRMIWSELDKIIPDLERRQL